MQKKRIVLGVTGSIAAYKAAELVRLIRKNSWDVSVVMTEAATHFVGELTFRTLSGNPVAVKMFDKISDWRPEHIALADSADVLVIAPCTANVIAKLANGFADDMLSAVALACKAPLLVAPAMNKNMYSNHATQKNLETLVSRGAIIVEPDTGDLACGYEGKGRMAEPAEIFKNIAKVLT
jgi:phosphopantothenoylcysteine decarboxylase/phosphopantothenate--cysteine ligase